MIAAATAAFARIDAAGVALAIWPRDLPLIAQAILGITIAEAIRYGLHRASHRPGWLGHVHRTHHQPERMYALNGPRLHPANSLWVAAAHALPMLLLGAHLHDYGKAPRPGRKLGHVTFVTASRGRRDRVARQLRRRLKSLT